MMAPLPEQVPHRDTFAPMRSATLVPSIALALALQAQTDSKVFIPYSSTVSDTPVVDTSADSGRIIIHESSRIASLMKDYASTKQPLKGYRVQIFLGDRTKAEETRRSFLVKHPDIPAYLSYLAPNFRVRVGDQRTKLEGEKLRQTLASEFPGLYVVPDEIEMPRLPDEQ